MIRRERRYGEREKTEDRDRDREKSDKRELS